VFRPPLSFPALVAAVAAISIAALPAFGADEPKPAAPPSAPSAPASIADLPMDVARIKKEAEALRPLLRSEVARGFLDATAVSLPPPAAGRTIFVDPATRTYLSEADAKKKTEEERAKLRSGPVSERLYYYGMYGTPLAYSRALEVLGEKGGVTSLADKRVLDFGCGGIGHLRLMAGMGADAVGVDVDPFFGALFSKPEDTGKFGKGSVTLALGRWPAEEKVKAAVGTGFDLILSKNTLKNGYLHPAKPVDKRMTVDLGVSDEAYVKALFDALKPGGRVLIYNLCPAPAKDDQPYIPWADGRSPFSKEMWEKNGFKVIAIDVNDDAPARAMGRALGWDKQQGAAGDLDNNLFAWYTLVEKPAK